MKKSVVVIIALLTLDNSLFSSCTMRILGGRTYVGGQHASKQGAKAQAHASKQAKHFWF